MRQVTRAEVPEQIAQAAEQVESYFLARGVLSWSLGNIQTRYKGPPVAEIVEATSADLVQAVRAADHVPLTVHDFTDAALLKLAFCCLGGRTVRLKLLNGRALTVRLEE